MPVKFQNDMIITPNLWPWDWWSIDVKLTNGYTCDFEMCDRWNLTCTSAAMIWSFSLPILCLPVYEILKKIRFLSSCIWSVKCLKFKYHCTSRQRAVTMIPAHDNPLAAMTFNSSGTMIATASEKVGHWGLCTAQFVAIKLCCVTMIVTASGKKRVTGNLVSVALEI